MWFVDLNSPETDSISHFPQHYPQAYVEKRQGGGWREGACWALSETGRPHVIYTKKNWTTKRFWGQQSKNKSQGQAQPGGAKKTKEKKVGWPTIFAMFILVEWQYLLVFSRELNNFAAPCLQYTIRLQIFNLCCLLGKEGSSTLNHLWGHQG